MCAPEQSRFRIPPALRTTELFRHQCNYVVRIDHIVRLLAWPPLHFLSIFSQLATSTGVWPPLGLSAATWSEHSIAAPTVIVAGKSYDCDDVDIRNFWSQQLSPPQLVAAFTAGLFKGSSIRSKTFSRRIISLSNLLAADFPSLAPATELPIPEELLLYSCVRRFLFLNRPVLKLEQIFMFVKQKHNFKHHLEYKKN